VKKYLFDELREALEDLAGQYDLEGEHIAEYVLDETPVSAPVRAALDAAVCFGCAIGVRRALDVIERFEPADGQRPRD
jgi:hypothetical protein